MIKKYKCPIIPFGIGSSFEGHLNAPYGGISIDMNNMNKNISKQFISTFDPNKINKSRTLLDNEKKDILKKLTNSISNRKILDSIHSAIELHTSGYIDIVLKKLFNYYYSEINTAQPQCIKYIDEFNKYYNRNFKNQKVF